VRFVVFLRLRGVSDIFAVTEGRTNTGLAGLAGATGAGTGIAGAGAAGAGAGLAGAGTGIAGAMGAGVAGATGGGSIDFCTDDTTVTALFKSGAATDELIGLKYR